MADDIVRQGYDRVAKKYSETRDQFKSLPYLEKFNSLLRSNSLILDIGCGAGKPIDEYLVNHGHRVLGIDISVKMIELARHNVPEGNFEIKDMVELKKREYSVDAVVSFYAIFHISRERHQALFQKIHSFLLKGGLLLVTMGTKKWEGMEDDFHGAEMYWSHYGAEKNRKIVEDAGFEVSMDKIDSSGREKHQVLMAQKIE